MDYATSSRLRTAINGDNCHAYRVSMRDQPRAQATKRVADRASIRAGDQVYVRLLDRGEILTRISAAGALCISRPTET